MLCDRNVDDEGFLNQIKYGLIYNKLIGNSYAASLYISLVSLLNNDPDDLSNRQIGLFSYGSGCTGEFFSASIIPNYKNHLRERQHKAMLENRQALDFYTYQKRFYFNYPKNEKSYELPYMTKGAFRLSGFEEHKRIYKVMD